MSYKLKGRERGVNRPTGSRSSNEGDTLYIIE